MAGAALLSICILCVSLSVLFFHSNKTLSKVDQTITDVDTAANNLNKAFVEMNRPDTGTLAEFNKTTLAVKGVLVHIDIAARHEDQQLTTLDSQERTLYSDMHQLALNGQGLLNQGTETLKTGQETIKAVQPVLGAAKDSLQATTQAVGALNKVIADPNIPATVAEAHRGATALADSSQEVKAMAVEGHQWFHSMLHPTWPSRIWHGALDVGHAFNPF